MPSGMSDRYSVLLSSFVCSNMVIVRLEHGVYGLVRVRDGAMSRYRGYQIPWEWMQDTGIVSQVQRVNCFP